MKANLIAFTGYGRAGKDEAAKALINAGYARKCFGDIIKGQLDELIRRHFGFSAFTEVDAEKAKIRRTLQYWGEDNYDAVFKEFFNTLPERCVNTRLCRVREAEEWRKRGGVIIEIRRPGVQPETEWAREQVASLRSRKLITTVIDNDSTVPALHQAIHELFELDAPSNILAFPA
jgi:hypothetical protein